MTKKIQHKDKANDSCNDFYPIRCQQGTDGKVLRQQNDGETYTFSSITNDFPNLSIQSAADCFRVGKMNNHLRRLFSPLAFPATLDNTSDPTYSSISSLETDKKGDNTELHPPVSENQAQEQATQNEEEDHIVEVNTSTNHYRLCKAKLAQDYALGKLDTSLTKNALTATVAPHLDTRDLIVKLDEVSKMVDIDVSIILAEEIKDHILGIVRSWIRRGSLPDA